MRYRKLGSVRNCEPKPSLGSRLHFWQSELSVVQLTPGQDPEPAVLQLAPPLVHVPLAWHVLPEQSESAVHEPEPLSHTPAARPARHTSKASEPKTGMARLTPEVNCACRKEPLGPLDGLQPLPSHGPSAPLLQSWGLLIPQASLAPWSQLPRAASSPLVSQKVSSAHT